MYDLQFDSAHRIFEIWQQQHPDDPLAPAFDAAAYLYSEFNRLHILQSELFVDDEKFFSRGRPDADPKVKQNFERALAKARRLSDQSLAKNPKDTEALFAVLMGSGLRSDYLALIERRYLASLSETRAGRVVAEKLLAIDPNYCDAYLTIGVENYLLSQKPAPVRWILRAGGAETSKERGLRDLRLTAEKGCYLAPYARLLLGLAALRDKNRSEARTILEGLTRQFPHNHLYMDELARLE